MIIDAHCHLPKDLNLSNFLVEKDIAGIEKSILILNTPKEQNAFIDQIELAKKNKNKLGILVGLDFKNESILDTLDIIKSNGFKFGIKLHSRFMHFRISDIDKILESMMSTDFDVAMVDGFVYGPDIETHIFLELLIAVSKAFPNKKIVFAHSGGIDILRTMLCTRSLDNVYYDLSLTVPYLFDTHIHPDILHFIKFTHTRTMFGSDSPDFTTKYALKKFFEIFDEMKLSSEIINNLLYSNANKIYSDIW